MLDWGFENYKTVHALAADVDTGTVKVKKGEFNKVGTVSASDFYYTIPMDGSDEIITTEIKLENSVKAPVTAGQTVGKVDIFESGVLIGSVDVIASESVAEGGVLSNFGVEDATAKKIVMWIIIIILLLILALAGYIIYLRWDMNRKKARRAARLKEKKAEEARRRALWEKQYEESKNREP